MSSRLASSASPVSAPLGLVNLDPATVPLTVTGAPNQAADLVEVRDSSGTVLCSLGVGSLFFKRSDNLATQMQLVNGANLFFQPLRNNSGNLTLGAASDPPITVLAQQVVIAGAAGTVPAVVQAAANHTADLAQWVDAANHVQLGIMNRGTGAAPVWALRVRGTANPESMAVAHTPGAATGRCIQVFDDAGSSLGYLALYA